MTQTIERTTLAQLLTNEDYARKVMPHMKGDYFGDRTERIVFEEINKLKQVHVSGKVEVGKIDKQSV